MTLYRISKNRWVPEAEAFMFLRQHTAKHGHYCNRIIDPNTCCPVAHGAEENTCTCIELSRLEQMEAA